MPETTSDPMEKYDRVFRLGTMGSVPIRNARMRRTLNEPTNKARWKMVIPSGGREMAVSMSKEV